MSFQKCYSIVKEPRVPIKLCLGQSLFNPHSQGNAAQFNTIVYGMKLSLEKTLIETRNFYYQAESSFLHSAYNLYGYKQRTKL